MACAYVGRHGAGARSRALHHGLIHNPPRSAPATDFVGFYEGILAEAARAVDEGVAAGGGRPRGRPSVRLLVFMGALGEAMHGHLLVGRPELTPALAETLVDTVLGGWTAPPPH